MTIHLLIFAFTLASAQHTWLKTENISCGKCNGGHLNIGPKGRPYMNLGPEPVCNEALTGRRGVGYRGCQTHTRSGRECQDWSSQSPHRHSRTPARFRSKGVGEHNYCRNPDGEKTIWCYTADPKKRWELCDPLPSKAMLLQSIHQEPKCDETLKGSRNSGYRGCQYRTRLGYFCQAWSSQYPHKHSRTSEKYPNGGLEGNNYCRNPDGESTIWCYTTDPGKRWDHCDPLSRTSGASTASGEKPLDLYTNAKTTGDCPSGQRLSESQCKSLNGQWINGKRVYYNKGGDWNGETCGCYFDGNGYVYYNRRSTGCNSPDSDEVVICLKPKNSSPDTLPGDNVSACQATCDNSGSCAGFHYVKSQKKCYFQRSTTCNVYPDKDQDCWAKVKDEQPGVDSADDSVDTACRTGVCGGEYFITFQKASNMKECSDACFNANLNGHDCKYFTYSPETEFCLQYASCDKVDLSGLKSSANVPLAGNSGNLSAYQTCKFSQYVKETWLSLKSSKASQVSTAWGGSASRAVDGDTRSSWGGKSCTHTKKTDHPWWEVALNSETQVDTVRVVNRQDCCSNRLKSMIVKVDGVPCAYDSSDLRGEMKDIPCGLKGSTLTIESSFNREYLTLCEVQIKQAELVNITNFKWEAANKTQVPTLLTQPYCVSNAESPYRNRVTSGSYCSGNGWTQNFVFYASDKKVTETSSYCVATAPNPWRITVSKAVTCGGKGWTQRLIFYASSSHKEGSTAYCVGYADGPWRNQVSKGSYCGTNGWTHKLTFFASDTKA